MGFTMAILFSYISSSPFIIQTHYHYTPFAFSLFFATNAVSIGIGAMLSARFKNHELSLKISNIGMIICSVILLIVLANNGSIIFFEGMLLILCFSMGMTFPVTVAFALNSARRQAGTASAILGASGFFAGSIVSPIVGLGNILVTTGIIFVIASVFSAFFAILASHYRKISIQ